jgi:uncharacterized membrane protein
MQQDSCALPSALIPPPPPYSPPPADGTTDGWIFIGVLMCLISVGLLVLGTNVQRYGLTVVPEKGCCGYAGQCLCCSCKNATWLSGWLIYGCGNGVYTYAVTLAPATLCSALLGTAVIWNALISRLLLGEHLEPCDIHGGLLIMAGIALTQVFGPNGSVEHTAPQFVALLSYAGGLSYLFGMLLLIGCLAALVLRHERDEKLTGGGGGGAVTPTGGVSIELGSSAGAPAPDEPPARHGAPTPTLLARAVPFAYPSVVGAIESLQQLGLIATSRMFYRSLAGDSQFCYAAFWIVLALLILFLLGQVWWLRKALLHLEVTRVLPIEYGTVASLSIIGSLLFFQESRFVPPNFGWAIAAGILLIAAGCTIVGSRWSPLTVARSQAFRL